MTGPWLRPARPTDAGGIAAILSDWTDSTPWVPRVQSRAEDLALAGAMVERGWVTLADTGAEHAAIAGFIARDAETVHALYVAPWARGHGLGARLLDGAMATAPHLTLWTFEANLSARRFYARQGFVEVARTDGANDEGLPDIQYRWNRRAA
ncbi:putative acetyltransferase [Roseivivax jejudonensis]|uniref:Putative acetyltransferase n=1 Tax=Roseivivax jejudonensis TaxID=1529041 RepID=A0A1X6ZSH8_9RHOB|nr:GNAT family N-acetyltransferase [Roseivivax jejudonensis]SLN60159.1 putative acetyltransferase [Roseivivax jejudonensis]